MVEPGTLEGEPWQMALNGNVQCLRYLYNSGEYSNLDIVLPGGVCIKAHRLILSMKSPVFGAMLMGPMAATGKQLDLPEDPPEIFRKLLDDMYLDQMNLKSVEEALEVYVMARKYLMEPARKTCKQMLSRDPDAVMSSETVTRLSKEALRELLKSDDFGFSSEAVPFKGLIAWGRAQLGPEEEEEPSGSGVRQKIGDDLLKEVRFLSMSCDEFVKNVFDTDVLTHTECFHIQRAITGADLSTLPEDTPLNPTREGRAPKLRKREELSCCKLDLSCSSVNYASFSEVALFEGLSSDATTQLHHMDVNRGCGGTLCVINYEGKTISSATSQNHQYTFTRPAVLVKGKKYRVVYCPSRSVELYRGRSGGSQRVGKTTLSWSLGHTCYSYIWEPTSS
ncbi:BTB/POZ domain-containing protein 1-like isoform X5 [Oratosquilla oratoria]|uniref:BTB/POZ domain-containing protein 1-like isoform X5 n=1 Tax=Oratosquilla oratoria TaxID=337810 RepID=UPI003F75DAA2